MKPLKKYEWLIYESAVEPNERMAATWAITIVIILIKQIFWKVIYDTRLLLSKKTGKRRKNLFGVLSYRKTVTSDDQRIHIIDKFSVTAPEIEIAIL